jgi:Superfamily II DNA/RNA helicases, SNF2 family
LTDSYAVTEDHQLVDLMPLGENYHLLKDLQQKISRDQAELFISVVLSSYDHLHVEGCIWEETPVSTRPTLVFEKVDDEKSLYLRVTESLPGVSMQFLEDFSPTVLSCFTPEGQLRAQKIAYSDTDALLKDVRRSIAACAPSRQTAKEVYEDDGFFILPPQVAESFLIGHLAALARDYVLLGADKLGVFRIRKATPKLRISSFSGIDFLEGKAELDLEGETLSLSDFLSQYRQNRYVQIAGGDRLIVDADYVERLERLVSRSAKGGKVKVSFFDLPEVASLLAEVPDEGIFRRSRAFYEGFNDLSVRRLRTPSTLKAELRPYQKEGVKWLEYLYDNDMGGCLADDMGLGKTVETIALLTRVMKAGSRPVLIVMPRSLLFNWQAEWRRFAPDIVVATYYGQDRSWDAVKEAQVILTTYAMARNDIETLSGAEFDTIVLDESQHIKNLSAKMSQAVLLLKAEHRFALSGTPVENHLGELYALMRFLNPAMLGSAEEFNRRYAVPVQRDNDHAAMEQLRRKITPFILRRLKGDVLSELPDRIDQTLLVEMEPAHAAFYERRRRYYAQTVRESIQERGVAKSQFELLQALTELRRIASVPESLSDGAVASSKLPVLADAVLEAVENGHKCVVFFNFIAGIELLGQSLAEAGVDYEVMTGATRDRASIVARFQDDPYCKVLLMTLKTGGVGLNLTAADTVFVVEPWWNKAAEEQAIGRLHRIGQKSSVHAFSIVTKDTIEEKIRQLQERKASLIEELIQSEGAAGKSLSEEDINFILS